MTIDLNKLEELNRAALAGDVAPDLGYAHGVVDRSGKTTIEIEPKALAELLERMRVVERPTSLSEAAGDAARLGQTWGAYALRLEAIVRDLAARQSNTLGSDGATWLNAVRCCEVPAPKAPSRESHLNHAADCPYRRAVEAMEP